MHQGDRPGQRRANTAVADDTADPGCPHRVAHQAEVQRLAVRRAAAGPLPDVAYEFGYPGFVEREFEKFLACGLLCHGFVRVPV